MDLIGLGLQKVLEKLLFQLLLHQQVWVLQTSLVRLVLMEKQFLVWLHQKGSELQISHHLVLLVLLLMILLSLVVLELFQTD